MAQVFFINGAVRISVLIGGGSVKEAGLAIFDLISFSTSSHANRRNGYTSLLCRHHWAACEYHGSHKKDDDSQQALQAAASPELYLVETIPLLNFSLELEPCALNTHEVLIGLVNNTNATLKQLLTLNLVLSVKRAV